MGQSGSSLGSGRGGTRMSLRFSRRSKLNTSNLSHTFSLPATDDLPELLNINTASEEQLMTLRGITRPIAHAIVEHRQLIGRFKKVDDLALVSGIGAEKLDSMRGEICVSKKTISRSSSCTQSLDSLRTNGDHPRLLSVNSASVFQLQCVPGLNQELAANIVDYRRKKGPFKSLDDIIKVRGMDTMRLGSIKHHLNLEQSRSDEITYLLRNGSVGNGICKDSKVDNNNSLNNISLPRTPGHRKSSSMPIKHAMALSNGFATVPVNDIFDLLSAYSHRPIIEENFCYERDGVKCCRFGTWNLHQLSIDKVNNPGVREVVCRTILENKISLLAVQDLMSEVALRLLCDELNCPTLRRVREWKSNSRRWKYTLSVDQRCRKLGFLYNTNCGEISIAQLSLDQLPVEREENRRQLAETLAVLQSGSDRYQASVQLFVVCGRHVVVANVLAWERLPAADCARLDAAWEAARCAGVQITALGEFHSADNVTDLRGKCTPLVSDGIHTTLDLNGSGRGDILTSLRDTASGYNGIWGVVRFGLSHLAIPRGWSWGGPASPHCPIWAEYLLPD